MKVKLLKKYRRRFKFVMVDGKRKMLDRYNDHVYTDNGLYTDEFEYKGYDYLFYISMRLLTGDFYWHYARDEKRDHRRMEFERKQIEKL